MTISYVSLFGLYGYWLIWVSFRYIPHFKSKNLQKKNNVGFINDMLKTWDGLSQDVIWNAINLQPKITRVIIDGKGGSTPYMNSGFAKS